MGRGCTDTQVSFENGLVSGYTNSNAPSNHSCHVFDPAGGGDTWPQPPSGISAGLRYQIFAWPENGVGTSNGDLIIALPISRIDVCNQINIILGNPVSMPYDGYSQAGDKFNGSSSGGGSYNDGRGHSPNNVGQLSGCQNSFPESYPAAAGANYWFYKTLLVR